MLLCAISLLTFAQTNFRSISFDEAIAAAKQENKMVFIDFFTDWCGPCKKMSRDVFPQEKVGNFFNKMFVCIKLNAEKEGKDLATRYNVKAYPTFIILNEKEEVLLELKGAMEGDIFIGKIQAGLDPERAPKRMEERYNSGERTPELINNYAFNKMEQNKENEGFKIVNDYFESLTDAQRIMAENSFLFTRYTIDLNDAKGKFMIDHRKKFAPSVSEDINNKISKLYHSKVVTYFSGYMLRENKFHEDEYVQLKKEIKDLELDKEYAYAPMFSLIESRLQHDDMTFLNQCSKEFDKLNKSDRDLLILNMSRLIQTEDKNSLKAMSQFIRSRLSTLEPSTISLSGRVLENIESMAKSK